MKTQHIIAITGSLVAGGCAKSLPVTAPYDGGNGYTYCSELTEVAAGYSQKRTVEGATLLVSGLVVGVAGALMPALEPTPDAGDERSAAFRVIPAASVGVGGLLTGLALYAFDRAEDAGKLAKESSLGLSADEDRLAYDICVSARASWIESRSTDNAALVARLEQSKRDAGSSLNGSSTVVVAGSITAYRERQEEEKRRIEAELERLEKEEKLDDTFCEAKLKDASAPAITVKACNQRALLKHALAQVESNLAGIPQRPEPPAKPNQDE